MERLFAKVVERLPHDSVAVGVATDARDVLAFHGGYSLSRLES
jgi:hypothetical protein